MHAEFPTRLEGIETFMLWPIRIGPSWFPTRLEGIETIRNLEVSGRLVVFPTRLEGIETNARVRGVLRQESVSDPP